MNCNCTPSQLGAPPSIICTTAMCAQGRAAVRQMRGTFEYLKSNPAFQRPRYEPSVDTIEKSFEDAYTIFSEWIPFNPNCCSIEETGRQAEEINRMMLESVGGSVPTVKPAAGGFDINLALGLVLGIVVVSQVLPLLKQRT